MVAFLETRPYKGDHQNARTFQRNDLGLPGTEQREHFAGQVTHVASSAAESSSSQPLVVPSWVFTGLSEEQAETRGHRVTSVQAIGKSEDSVQAIKFYKTGDLSRLQVLAFSKYLWWHWLVRNVEGGQTFNRSILSAHSGLHSQ